MPNKTPLSAVIEWYFHEVEQLNHIHWRLAIPTVQTNQETGASHFGETI